MNKIFLLCVLGVVATIVAVTIFKIPLNTIFFFGILLACPLMHFFMMSGRHDHQAKDKKV
ncbi:hypothetical protein A3C98_04870 [Candidatus Roizmanbacteria bacterium RIFCSPHIGHO2_02_FULL_37_15]|uniref:DUF2933 domain-containing protein n=1 Tax=Candidatus Roizmanbacteria bacterium RIFCSPLOWO2_01_FULL_37_16 TaxID=1802058 RepID=A0A1F7IQN2_9BACT|nr:MAG: hypothetical protein A2859_03385 [Candidatus Roizmanbacteria bacterium RIFCSPHIGHO2_01_FULL_37_16b]OGK22404.1 MAG: hypothetical protein A3C98_04870 [Candidatus Roizmanbacteria bacterium RIFCSPHIGHO2_02_FULL_37_15]OGK32130.1 MAG: hypothetical protein A3F57_03610 [Candidatus Roizmanbacteria bacterium RIFCSPHIGHO2_12_FULL_36_11]OGK45674.1 MAG: hypothetical protein A3B40_04305 [Candidatus Roizmanbacteria bacterium RIFCSPLOWO2_01_FULL_37_16]OGK57854.1 MAG: hypothetical protein A3I50_02295 [C